MRVWPFRLRICRTEIGIDRRRAWEVERWWPNGANGCATAYTLRKAWSMRPKLGKRVAA
jgi:hypothetical protein